MRFPALYAVASLLLAPAAPAVLAQEAASVSLAVVPASAKPGQEVELQLKLSVAHPWHVFGDTPGSAGQQKLKLETKLPEGVVSVSDWKWPAQETVFEGYEVHVYNAGNHVFTRKVKVNAVKGPVTFTTSLTYQACNPEYCGPVEVAQVSAELKIAAAAPAQKESLVLGDPAPPLTIQRWLKGEPIARFEKGRTYVVEFGATWCPPCRKAIPHLTRLTRQYADKITVIGVFAREQSNKEDPTDLRYIDKVIYQMQAMGEKMDFNIAVDVPQQTTGDAWMIRGVPSAFVVDGEGRIAWIGHPAQIEPVFEQLAAGTFDPAKAAREQEEMQAGYAEVDALNAKGDYMAAVAIVDRMMAQHPEANWLLMMKYSTLVGKDDKRADTLLREILDADPEGFDWDHFIYDTYTRSKNPNYELALATADRAVQHAETKLVAANLLNQKAKIYQQRSKSRAEPADAHQDIAQATQVLQQALELSKSTGDPRDTERFQKALDELKAS